MLIVKKNWIHAKGRANPLDIINAITYGTSIYLKHTKEFYNLGPIMTSTNNNEKSIIWAKKLIP